MKIQRINKNVIKCIMSSEEMHLHGVRVEDLMDDRKKAEEFLQYVLSQARYEVDFVTNGDVLNVQLSVMNDGGVTMMISDDQSAAIRAIAEQFKERLREFSKAFEEAGNSSEDNNYSKEKVIKYFISSEGEKDIVSYDFWSHMASLDDCILLSKALRDISDTPSDLYKYYEEYYLCIHLTIAKSEIAKYVFIMSEYSDDVSSDQSEYLMIKEHGKVIIKKNALRELLELR